MYVSMKPKKPKPSTGYVRCEGCGLGPSKCSCGGFRTFLLVAALSVAMLFGFALGVRVGVAHTEQRIERGE